MASAELEAPAARENAAAARLVRRVLSQWWLILACALVAAVAGYFASSSSTKIYSASTTIQLNEVDLAQVFLGQYLQQQGQDAQNKSATNAKLVTYPRVREAASRALGGTVTPAELKGSVSAAAQPDTTLIDITATSDDPAEAARIADAVREAFIEVRRQAAVGQFNDAKASLSAQLAQVPKSEKSSPAAAVLRDRLQQVDTLRAVSNGGVETVQTARIPSDPVAPNPKRSAILAFFAGLLIGTGVALVRARMDDRILETSELSEQWDLPVLGLIPQASELKRNGSHLAGGAALEAFGLARTNLRYLHVGGEVKTVVVTSAIAEEGKSTVVWNLAVAAAMVGTKVLVIDGDLRRPVVGARAGITSSRGLSEVLAGIAEPAEVIITTNVASTSGDVTLDVVTAGLAPPSPIALLERGGTSALFAKLGEGYDLVLIDTPPATVVADAKVMLGYADGVVIVSRLGQVTRSAFGRLRDILTGLETPVLGIVVNSGASGKSYGYSTYEAQSSAPVAASVPRSAEKTVESI